MLLVVSLSYACGDRAEVRAEWTPIDPNRAPPVALDVLAAAGEGSNLYHWEHRWWPDSCLGVEVHGGACLLVETRGYMFLVEKNGWLIEYHADDKGGFVRAGFVGPLRDYAPDEPIP